MITIRFIIVYFIGITVFNLLNCISPNSDNTTSLHGVWQIRKVFSSRILLDDNIEASRSDTTIFLSESEGTLYSFSSDSLTIHSIKITESYSSNTKITNYDSCYDRSVLSYKLLDNHIIIGSNYTMKYDSLTHFTYTSEINFFKLTQDTLVLHIKGCAYNVYSDTMKTVSEKYLVGYNGPIPPSNWPDLCTGK